MIGYNKDAVPTPCEPGVTRRILSYCDEMMMCEITFEKGARGNLHSHPHIQQTYVAAGAFEFTVGDEVNVVKQGDSVLIPSGATHGVLCLEAGKLVDVFNPKREDFLK
ncbi:MAG: cupin domain-containing protein [Lachnospiraceae bacterium]|nr:cupin domain-containing protein [Lachnospiraceae bacterium]